jgi:enoyl-CoA hydratase
VESTCFEVERIGTVAHLRLCRPDAYNTMTRAFWSELPQLVTELDRPGDVRAIVLSSTGKHFSAGMDLAVFTGGEGGGSLGGGGGRREEGRARAQLRQTVLLVQETFNALERTRVPVLAAIQGGCIGGAVDMISACDMRYCSADAFFVIQEINIGMTADVGTLQRLPKIIPDGVAREMAYRGLVNHVYDTHEQLVEGVLDIAAEIASKSPLAVWGTKEMLNYTRDHTVADSLEHIATWQAGMFHPADMLESFTAKAEGRDPEFEDLGPHPSGF